MEIAEIAEGIVFAARVTPRASRDAIEGEYRGALKVRLTAPPVENRANVALCRLLAERLNVPASAVRIVADIRSRTKRVAISCISCAQILALLSTAKKEGHQHHAGH